MPALEGLDMNDAVVPPLLRPNAACSWPAFEVWERFVLTQLLTPSLPLTRAIDRIAIAAELLRTWTMKDGPLDQWMAEVASRATSDGRDTAQFPPAWSRTLERSCRARALVLSCVPEDIRPGHQDAIADDWQTGAEVADEFPHVVRRYLAARFWASWVVHDGGGLRTGVRWLELVHDVLLWELGATRRRRSSRDRLLDAIGQSDLLLVHLLNPSALARRLSAEEPRPLLSPPRRSSVVGDRMRQP